MSVICSGGAYRLLYKRLWFDTMPYAAINLADLILCSEAVLPQPQRRKINQTLKLYNSTLWKKSNKVQNQAINPDLKWLTRSVENEIVTVISCDEGALLWNGLLCVAGIHQTSASWCCMKIGACNLSREWGADSGVQWMRCIRTIGCAAPIAMGLGLIDNTCHYKGD